MTESDRETRIARLTEAVRRAREGDFSVPLELTGRNDEIDALSREVALLVESVRGDVAGRLAAEESLRLSEQRYHETFENAPVGIFRSTRHVGGRKRVEERLNEQLHFLQQLLDTIPLPVFFKDTKGAYLGCNTAFEELCGVPRECVVGRTIGDLVPPDLADIYRDADAALFRTPGVQIYEAGFQGKDGSTRDVIFNRATYVDAEGRVAGIVGAITDITRLKRAERELRLANLIVENSPAVLFRWRAAEGWPVESVSRNVTRFGYTPAELVTGVVPFATLVHPDDLQRVADEVAEFSRRGVEHFQQEYRIVTKQGEVCWVDDRSAVERDGQGRISHFQGVVMDITERKRAEEALRESEEKFRVLAQTSPTAIILIQGGRIMYANPAASQISGYELEQLLGMRYWEVVHDEFREQLRMRGLARQRGEQVPGRYETKIVTRAGEECWVVVSGARMEYGGNPAIIVTLQDITETRRAGERIRDALAEKEILLREIHHRVKNNLQIISTLLDLQSESLRGEGALRAFRESQDRIRAMALVHEKLYRTENLSSIDFSGYIESLTTQLYDGYAIDPERIFLSIDAGRVCLGIDQAIPCGLIINELVSNSLKYAFPGNRKGEIVIRFRGEENGMVCLTVADNGVGLPDTLDVVTASETLGLQLVRMLVKQLRGEVVLDASQGASFNIRFPGIIPGGGQNGGELTP
jgi:PAS domain S-box-containing protein